MVNKGISNKKETNIKKRGIKELQSEISNVWKVFPQEKKEKILTGLLKKRAKSKEPTLFVFPQIGDYEKVPASVPLCILSSDWPGLSESCIGVLHERGWNLSYIEGFIIEYGGEKLGGIFLVINIATEIELKKFLEEKNNIIEDLRVVATGSKVKTSLLIGETRKLEIYGYVLEKIKGMVKSEEEEKKILKSNGEVFKFFSSRSSSYLEERSYADLAQQIVTNYRFQHLVRKTGGRPKFWIKNIKTSRENLTGITIAAFERDNSLNDWLEAIYQAVTDYNIKYNKEFITEDGIVVYRIELCDRNNKPYSNKKIQAIKNALMKAHISRKMEKVRWMELMGGFEHYMRAIIPLLVKEYKLSKESQAYINIVQMTSLIAKFKIIIVAGAPLPGKTGYGYTITQTLEGENGIETISTKPPKKYGEVEVDIIDISVDLYMFPNIENVYRIIRKCISDVIGKFRDFDEGMRKLEVSKLGKVKKMLKSYSENLVKEFYYKLDDFYRIGADTGEIAEQIKLGIKGLERYIKGSEKYVILKKDFSLRLTDKTIPSSTIIALIYSSKRKFLSHILQLLHNYEVTLSRVERKNITIVILRLQQNNKPIPLEEVKKLKIFFETIKDID